MVTMKSFPGEGLQDGEINYPENWFEITPDVEAIGRIRVGAEHQILVLVH